MWTCNCYSCVDKCIHTSLLLEYIALLGSEYVLVGVANNSQRGTRKRIKEKESLIENVLADTQLGKDYRCTYNVHVM